MTERPSRIRAAAGVMAGLAEEERELAARFATTGRNDPCPCGSGKKYKKCHGAGQVP